MRWVSAFRTCHQLFPRSAQGFLIQSLTPDWRRLTLRLALGFVYVCSQCSRGLCCQPSDRRCTGSPCSCGGGARCGLLSVAGLRASQPRRCSGRAKVGGCGIRFYVVSSFLDGPLVCPVQQFLLRYAVVALECFGHASNLPVSLIALSSVILRSDQRRRVPCHPSGPRWQAQQSGMLINHIPCSGSWTSDPSYVPHTMQGRAATRRECSFSAAV